MFKNLLALFPYSFPLAELSEASGTESRLRIEQRLFFASVPQLGKWDRQGSAGSLKLFSFNRARIPPHKQSDRIGFSLR
jgi:hypothetical protein